MESFESFPVEDEPFDPKSIYNPAYQEKLESSSPQNDKLPGQIFHKSDNSLAVGISRDKGLSVKEIWSTDNLEEDLSMMYGKGNKKETVFSEEKHEEIINRSFKSILERYGKYMDPAKLNEVFPNLNINSIDTYDFRSSNLRFFILGHEDFDTFKEAYQGGEFTGLYVGPAESIDASFKFSNGQQVAHFERVNIAQKNLVIVGETGELKPGRRTARVKQQLERELEETIRHEILHALGVGNLFLPTSKMDEGVVAYYAQKSMSEDRGYSYVNESAVEYADQYKMLDLLMGLSEMLGVSEETQNKAFLGNDAASVAELKSALSKEMGNAFVSALFTNGFEHSKGGWKAAMDQVWEHGDALYSKLNPSDEQD